MNTLMIISFSIVMFVLCLRAETSGSHHERQKFHVASFVILTVALIVGLKLSSTRSDDIVFLYLFTFSSVFLPLLIVRFINYLTSKNRPALFQLRIDAQAFKILMAVFWLLLIGMNLWSPSRLSQSDFHSFGEFFVYRSGYALNGFIVFVFLLLEVLQTIKVYEEGLYFDGFLWKWSDFHSYCITTTPKRGNFRKVTLNLAKKIWFPINDIYLQISVETAEQFDSWLNEKIQRVQEPPTQHSVHSTGGTRRVF